MPKGTRNKYANASKSMWSGTYGTTGATGENLIGQSREKARTIVGDQGVDKIQEQGRRAYAKDKQMTPTQRKESAAKAKSTVDTAMDEAIEMVKKKKTASRGAY